MFAYVSIAGIVAIIAAYVYTFLYGFANFPFTITDGDWWVDDKIANFIGIAAFSNSVYERIS